MNESPLGDRRIYGMIIGTVADRLDPRGLGRVRILAPPWFDPDPTAWAWPLGGGGGGPRQGGLVVPQKGAEVAVFFKEGDPEHPYFLAANWGAPGGARETPTPVAELGADLVPDVAVFEFGDYFIAIDARAGSRGLKVVHKPSGAGDLEAADTLEHDGEKMGWRIKGTAAIVIQSDGQIDLDAPLVTVNKRVVQTTPRGI